MSTADTISRSTLLALLRAKELTQGEIITLVMELPPSEVDRNYTHIESTLPDDSFDLGGTVSYTVGRKGIYLSAT
jgi:hypothetical protein